MRFLSLIVFYALTRYLPASAFGPIGALCRVLRSYPARFIFKRCGRDVRIDRRAHFGTGRDIEIGDGSNIGLNAEIPSNLKMGHHVMMAPNVVILARSHHFARLDIPMSEQGWTEKAQNRIEDDVWIGRDVIIMPGIKVHRGAIVGARAVVTKDVPEYAIVAGNPASVIRYRKPADERLPADGQASDGKETA